MKVILFDLFEPNDAERVDVDVDLSITFPQSNSAAENCSSVYTRLV